MASSFKKISMMFLFPDDFIFSKGSMVSEKIMDK